MLEQLRAWLNGSREYYAGVSLYAEANGDPDVLAVLKKGPTPFSTKRLHADLLGICNELKGKENDNILSVRVDSGMDKPGYNQASKGTKSDGKEPVNSTLYEACREEAGKAYKTAMNDRAILFSLAKMDGFEDPNMPDKIAARATLAINVVKGYQAASLLYDRAAYVKLHGRLPDAPEESGQANYDHLADDQVYQSLNNLRKALSKLKKREQTPERIALQQQHGADIKKLEARWHLLKGK